MKVKKILFLLISFLTFNAYSQTVPLKDYNELLNKYETLIKEYEETLNDYNSLLNDYEKLNNDYKKLKSDYETLAYEYKKLLEQHSLDISIYEKTKNTLEASNKIIENLEKNIKYLLNITDTRFFTIYTKIGYAKNSYTFGIATTFSYPNVPVSLLFNFDYLGNQDALFNLQVGVGFKF